MKKKSTMIPKQAPGKYSFLFVMPALLLFPFRAICQDKSYNEEVTVVAPYEPTITDAQKIELNPAITDTLVSKPDFTYSIFQKQYNTGFGVEPIKPARMVSEPLTKLYSSLLKAGYGNYSTPYGELFVNSLRSKENVFGVHLKHLSSKGKIENYGNPYYSENLVDVFARRLSKQHYALYGNISYKRDAFQFYGYRTDVIRPMNIAYDNTQHFSLLSMDIKYYTTYADSNHLNYNSGISYYHLGDNFKTSENNLNVSFSGWRNKDFFDFTDNQTFGLEGGVRYYNFKADQQKASSNAIIDIQPTFRTRYEQIDLSAGLDVDVQADTTAYLHLYPKLEAKMEIIRNILGVKAGLTGSMERNSFKTLGDENPYIISNIPLNFRNNKYKIYAGVKTNISRNLDIYLGLAQWKIDGMPFFMRDTTTPLRNKFTVAYDTGTILLDFVSEVNLKVRENLDVSFRFNYHEYSTSTALPWYRPDYEVNLAVRYNILDKILLKGDLYIFDRKYEATMKWDPTQGKAKLESLYVPGITDVNFGIEYRYNKKISAFLNLNNVGSKHYEVWYDYPCRKFNFLAGLTFGF